LASPFAGRHANRRRARLGNARRVRRSRDRPLRPGPRWSQPRRGPTTGRAGRWTVPRCSPSAPTVATCAG
jgi:hypothetical protein